MLRIVRNTLARHGMVSPGERIVVAVSGGPDSVALLRIFQDLAPEMDLSLVAVHVHHGVRGKEADREARFVERLCECLGVPCRIGHVQPERRDGARMSLETFLRQERYRLLDAWARDEQAQRIALGHQRDDNVETVCMHLLRGAGPEGLAGIPPVRDNRFIRPLLDVDRKHILAFLEREGLPWVSDPSNADPAFFRNRIRCDLLPRMRVHALRLDEGLHRFSALVREENDYLRFVVAGILAEWGVSLAEPPFRLRREAFQGLHRALRGRIVRTLLAALRPAAGGIFHCHVEAVLALAEKPRPRALASLPGGIRARCDGDRLVLERQAGLDRVPRPAGSDVLPCRDLPIPGTVAVPELAATFRCRIRPREALPPSWEPETSVWLDLDRIVPPLQVRGVHPGDWIQPLGLAGSKKLQDLFVDAKVPREARPRVPVVADAESIVCVWGIRLGERVKVTEETRQVLHIERI